MQKTEIREKKVERHGCGNPRNNWETSKEEVILQNVKHVS